MTLSSLPKVLIIDDEATIRQSFSDHLEDLDYQVFTAKNGLIGLEIIEREQPELILTDLRMPEMGGLEVIENLRERGKNTPIIVVSGAGHISDAIEAIRLGAWDYILKPIKEMSVLTHLVEKALEKKRILEENTLYQENLEKMVSERTLELKQEKERTQQILDSIHSGVLVIDAKTHEIIEANPAAIAMIEASEDEIIGRVCHKFVCPTEMGSCPITDRGQVIDNSECLLLTKDGKKKNILKTVEKVTLNKRECLLESFLDISDRITVEKKLQESENKFKTIINQSTDGIILADMDGNFTLANASFSEMIGYSKKELLEKTVFDIKAKTQDGDFFDKAKINQNDFRIQVRLEKKDETELTAEVLGKKIIINDKEQVLGIIRDVTERNRIQYLQSTLYRISQAANRAYTPDVLYPIIHEIVNEIMPAKNFYIALYNEENNIIYPVYFRDEEDSTPPIQLLSRGITAYVLKTAEALLCPSDKYDDLLAQKKIEEGGAPCPIWLGVPLITNGKTIGVMAVQHYQDKNAFGEEEKKLLEIISASVSSAIAKQLAQSETHTYAQINALLFNAAQEISETLELSVLYNTLYEIISKMIPCDFMMISSYNAEEKQIYCQHLIMDGKKQDISQYPPLPLNTEKKGTQSIAIHTGKPIIIKDYLAQIKTSKKNYRINDASELKPPKAISEEEKRTRSALIVPLILEGEVTGVIQVMSYNLDAYNEYDLHILEALSSYITIASNNAYLYEQSQAEIKLRVQAEKELRNANIVLEERVEKRTNELKERIQRVDETNFAMANVLNDFKILNAIAEENAQSLKQANAELESFSYSVSHDLRAPLRHIESFTKLLNKNLENKLDEKSSRYISHIIESTERMRALIEDLLTLSRTSRADLHIKAVDLNGIIESVRANLLGEEHQREIVWRVAPLPLIKADAGLIKILWENLIGNAIKYTRTRKEAIIEIDILPTSTEEDPLFFIRDNGVGFPPEYKEQLFNVFERLHKSEDFEGSGVGLATVKRIIERHNGEIWAEGEVDKGATFYFSLRSSDL